jgi:hypothetical protein
MRHEQRDRRISIAPQHRIQDSPRLRGRARLPAFRPPDFDEPWLVVDLRVAESGLAKLPRDAGLVPR